MRYSRITTAALFTLGCLFFTSCFKDEPLNAECDIEQAYIHTDKPTKMFENITDTLVKVQSNETNITFTMKVSADITKLAPQFRLTPGATISPESGSIQDFSQGPVTYVVTSEDKNWTRTYTVSVKNLLTIKDKLTCNFETSPLVNNKYYTWLEPWDEGDGNFSNIGIWATGNPGFNISNGSAKPNEYPTAPDKDGYDGACVKLTTCRTSKLADMVKKPIAAGNLFIGSFDPQNALQDAMKATKFGRPFSFISKPVTFSGYYKYLPGETYTDKNMNVLDAQDKGTIYAVLYDNHDTAGNAIVLYGDNVQTSEQVVALAILPDIDKTTTWTPFNINFVYKKDIDGKKLKNGGYSLAIVCSSSTKGAEFMGAVGSTLWIDKFSITCENNNNN